MSYNYIHCEFYSLAHNFANGGLPNCRLQPKIQVLSALARTDSNSEQPPVRPVRRLPLFRLDALGLAYAFARMGIAGCLEKSTLTMRTARGYNPGPFQTLQA